MKTTSGSGSVSARDRKHLIGHLAVLSLIFLSLVLAGCGGSGNVTSTPSSDSGGGIGGGGTVGGTGDVPILTWIKPTTNADGSALTNLAGYRIYYGRCSRDYTEMIELDDPEATECSIGDLSAGFYFFSITAYNGDGVESYYTKELSKEIVL